MERFLIAYVPVIHQGYLDLFRRHAKHVATAFVLGSDVLKSLGSRREIRALDPSTACVLVRSLSLFRDVQELVPAHASLLAHVAVVVPNDRLTRLFAERHLATAVIEHDSAFLRWDEDHVFSQNPVTFSRTSTDPFDQEMMDRAADIALRSSDWWRHVGALVVREGIVLGGACNQHLPTEHAPYVNGDPRDVIKAGQSPELCSALHGEQSIIAEAARVVLAGTDFYVTTFPCPVCAKLLAYARIKRLYFRSGHASLDGERILRDAGVEIIHVPAT